MNLRHALLIGVLSAAVGAAAFGLCSKVLFPPQPSEPAYARVIATHTLRCAYSSLAGYFVNVDPTHNVTKGLVHDITEQMGRILGLKIEWVEEIGPNDVAQHLEDGREDAMCFPTWPSGDMAAHLDYTVPLDFVPIYAYVRLNDTRFDGDLTKIDNKDVTIPVISGGMDEKILSEDFPHVTRYALPGDADALRLLLAVTTKNADVAFTDAFTGDSFIKNNPDSLQRVVNVPPVRVLGDSFAVAKGETKLKDMLNLALMQMQRSGYIRNTIDKYLADDKGLYFYVSPDWER